MEISWIKIIILLFLVWMAYFSLGAFANMTENKILLSIFKLFKILLILTITILVTIYFYMELMYHQLDLNNNKG